MFETLGWRHSPFLQSKIAFKPPIIDQLARAAGIDPAALDLLRKLGITNLADLSSRLGVTNPPSEPEPSPALVLKIDDPVEDVYDGAKDLYGDDMPDIPDGSPDPEGGDGIGGGTGHRGESGAGAGKPRSSGHGGGGANGGLGDHDTAGGKGNGNGGGQGKRTIGHAGGRAFVSYIATHLSDDGPDPDGLDQELRMRLEAKAIDEIIKLEPELKRTPEGNKGFDLYESDAAGYPRKWVEVKSMTSCLMDRPVGMSRAQFSLAQEKGTAFWLYVVEYADEPNKFRILKINDPAGQSNYFTFDQGWIAVAHDLAVRPRPGSEEFNDNVIE